MSNLGIDTSPRRSGGSKKIIVACIVALVIIAAGVAGVVWWKSEHTATDSATHIQIDEKALEGDSRSNNVRIAAQTATTQVASGDTNGAIATLNRAINGTSNTDEKVSLYLQLASVYANAGDKANALANESAAIKLQPNNWRLYKHQGSLFYQLGDSANAKVSYLKALELIKGTADEKAYASELQGLASGTIQ